MQRGSHFADAKKKRIQLALNYIQKYGQVPRGRIVAYLAIEHGLTQRKANEYIDLLVAGEYIRENKDGILTIGLLD